MKQKTSNPKMQRADIKIGFQCNNHCAFCAQGDEKKSFCHFRKKAEIESAIKKSKKVGKNQALFTGGEPTLHPHFLHFLNYAKKAGFDNIHVQSNGRMFAYYDFCVRVINAGMTQFGPAVHGPNAKIHDFLTDAPGSFDQTIQGIKNMRKLNQQILVNTVITSKNYKFLPDIARLLVDLGVSHFQFAYIHIVGRAAENKNWIPPRKREIMPYVKKGLDIGISAGLHVVTEAIPHCFMKGYEKCVAEEEIPEAMVFDAGFVVEDFLSHMKNEAKKKGPECHLCKYDLVCDGPWKEYPEIFGWSEFKPVKQ